MKNVSLWLRSSALLLGAGLAACGGGGSSGGSSPAARTTTVSGIVGGTASSPTLAGQPLGISGTPTVNGRPSAGATVKPGMLITGTVASGSAAAAAAPGAGSSAVAGGSAAKPAAAAASASLSLGSVDIRRELSGPIGAIDLVAATLTVAGRTVATDALTVIEAKNADGSTSSITLADLAGGQYVEVYAQALADGSLLASRIERQRYSRGSSSYNTVEVHGAAMALDTVGRSFTLGTLLVDYSAATVRGTLVEGGRVEVYGTLSGTTLMATSVEAQGSRSGTPGSGVELEGTLSGLDTVARSFSLQGYTVDYSAVSPMPSLVEGARVELRGSFDASVPGLVHATRLRVEFEDSGDGSYDGEVKGPIDSIDTVAMQLSVGGTLYYVDDATVIVADDRSVPFATLAAGNYVELKFDSSLTLAGATYARKIELRSGSGGSSGSMELEGRISGFDSVAQSFVVNGVTVMVAPATRYELDDQPSTAADFFSVDRSGRKVEVKGHGDAGGNFVADKIELGSEHS